MKGLSKYLWMLSALVLVHTSLLAVGEMAGTPQSSSVKMAVGDRSITALFPKNVSAIIRTPENNPTFVQGTAGNEGVSIGRTDFDLYSIQVFDEQALKRHEQDAGVNDLDLFIDAELAYYGKKSEVKNRDQLVPESLKGMNNKTERYLSFEGAKGRKFLWRILLINGRFVVIQREVGAKTKIDPTSEKAWTFLTSVQVG